MEKNTEYEKMLMKERDKLMDEMEQPKTRRFPISIIFFTLVGIALTVCGIVSRRYMVGLSGQSAAVGVLPASLMIAGAAVVLFGVLYNIFTSINNDTRHTSLTSRCAQIDETIAVMSAENKTPKCRLKFDLITVKVILSASLTLISIS